MGGAAPQHGGRQPFHSMSRQACSPPVFNDRAGGTGWSRPPRPTGLEKSSEACGEWRAHARPRAQANPGAVAQLGERLICTQEVVGSTPISSTSVGRQARRTCGPILDGAPAAGAGL